MSEVYRLMGLGDAGLARCDPLRMNLAAASGVPGLEAIDVEGYAEIADSWADEIRAELAQAEHVFHKTPGQWKGDVRFFRLGVLCWYVEERLGVRYNDDQRGAGPTLYTDPADLFLHGVMDSRRGTCANMAALHVALGRRLGWPVSLACVGSHFICRFDDGAVTHNIEATQSGFGGFKSDPDDYLIRERGLPPEAVSSGSDLRALTPRELLGAFVGLRARLMKDTGRPAEAERDYLLARHLFPSGRSLYQAAVGLQVLRGGALFSPHEDGSPAGLARFLRDSGLDGGWVRGLAAPAGWQGRGAVGFNAGDSNVYRYVGNSPTNATDPSGLAAPPAEFQMTVKEPIWNHAGENKYGEFKFLFRAHPEGVGMNFAISFTPSKLVDKEKISFIQIVRTTNDDGKFIPSDRADDEKGWHVDNKPGQPSGWYGFVKTRTGYTTNLLKTGVQPYTPGTTKEAMLFDNPDPNGPNRLQEFVTAAVIMGGKNDGLVLGCLAFGQRTDAAGRWDRKVLPPKLLYVVPWHFETAVHAHNSSGKMTPLPRLRDPVGEGDTWKDFALPKATLPFLRPFGG